jgi:hypothetical protein
MFWRWFRHQGKRREEWVLTIFQGGIISEEG